MMLVQHMSTPPEPPASMSSSSPPPRPPEPIRHFHGRINHEAPESVLQLNKSAWTSLQSTTSPLTTTISASTATTTTTTTTTHPSLSSSQSSLPSTDIHTTAKLGTSPTTNTSPPPFTIIPAKPHHAAQIRHIGSTVFANTFGFSIPPRDLSAYLTSSYSAASIQAELASPQHHFLVAVAARPQPEPRRTGSATAAERGCERGKPDDDDTNRHETNTAVIGFAQVTQHTTEPCLSHLAPESLIELQRLYVLPSHQNLGVGRALLAAAEDVARRVQLGATITRTRTPKLTAARGELASRREQHRRRAAGEGMGIGMEWEWEWNEPDGVVESFDECEDEDDDEEDDEDDEEDLVGVRVGSGMRPRLTSKPKPKRKINMWLGVWEGNFVAQNVYEKNGYERVGEHEFRMGRCVQIDWIMVKELEC